MSVSLFILLLIQDAYRYDTFHPNGEQVFRVNTEAIRKSGGTEGYASSPFPVGSALTQGYAQVETTCRMVRHFNGEATAAGKYSRYRACLRNRPFFSYLDLRFWKEMLPQR